MCETYFDDKNMIILQQHIQPMDIYASNSQYDQKFGYFNAHKQHQAFILDKEH